MFRGDIEIVVNRVTLKLRVEEIMRTERIRSFRVIGRTKEINLQKITVRKNNTWQIADNLTGFNTSKLEQYLPLITAAIDQKLSASGDR